MQLLTGDCLEKLKTLPDNSVDSIVTDPPYGWSFMGKTWDYDVPKVAVWKEAMRVLKPGGHILCACGTRTQHRMAVNIEDAGFEIRDIVAWVYGSGFPKSLNIGKAINKIDGVAFDSKPSQGVGFMKPDSEDWHQTKNMLIQKEESTERAKAWEGWGTALKPAMELWTLARKPLSEKTVAENVLKHGTGGINIDGSRVGTTGARNNGNSNGTIGSNSIGVYGKAIKQNYNMGRFPANFIHDGSEEVVGGFPKQAGASGQATGKTARTWGTNGIYGEAKGDDKLSPFYADEGSASRFFYCAKSSKSERNKGLEGFEEKERVDYGGFHSEKGLIENGRNPQNRKPLQNNHPTVKPVSLMRYLCKLITPPGGIVLDPFMGSGSTGIAAKLEGFDFIGIEIDPEYVKIAEARIKAWEREPEQLTI